MGYFIGEQSGDSSTKMKFDGSDHQRSISVIWGSQRRLPAWECMQLSVRVLAQHL